MNLKWRLFYFQLNEPHPIPIPTPASAPAIEFNENQAYDQGIAAIKARVSNLDESGLGSKRVWSFTFDDIL